mmetsp:Transcript_36530/g.60818  ORF Transcript_36530/g.60818 Transcript_36530/m.60818 type:complete len:225 (-) Transcript_36530:8-682(-)
MVSQPVLVSVPSTPHSRVCFAIGLIVFPFPSSPSATGSLLLRSSTGSMRSSSSSLSSPCTASLDTGSAWAVPTVTSEQTPRPQWPRSSFLPLVSRSCLTLFSLRGCVCSTLFPSSSPLPLLHQRWLLPSRPLRVSTTGSSSSGSCPTFWWPSCSALASLSPFASTVASSEILLTLSCLVSNLAISLSSTTPNLISLPRPPPSTLTSSDLTLLLSPFFYHLVLTR